MSLRVVFEPSGDGGYTVYVPALPGCISQGNTLEEARKNIMKAIELYLDSKEDRRLSDENQFSEEVIV